MPMSLLDKATPEEWNKASQEANTQWRVDWEAGKAFVVDPKVEGAPIPYTGVAPKHYKKYKIEPWEYILANDLDFFQGNVVKYITRWKDKGGMEDLCKAQYYLEKYIDANSI